MKQTPSKPTRLLAQKLMMSAAALTLAACAAPAGVSQTQQSLETAGVPDVSASMLTLADQLAGEGKYAAALPLYKRAHELDGGSETAIVGLGNALLKTGRNTEALETYENAVDEFSHSAAALDGMGRAWMALGRPGVALPAFEAALARDPGFVPAINGKGVALASLGRTKEALATFEDGLKHSPDDLALKNNYGLALTLAGQSDLGIPVLKEVVLDDRARAGHRQTLAMAYGVAGQTENARQMAAIDNDLTGVDQQIASFDTLAALPENERAAAAMGAVAAPKHDLSAPANRVYIEPVDAAATVKRLLLEPEPVAEVVPEPEPAPAPVEESIDIPPLDDNVGYAVQIAAYRHASELTPGWQMLKEKYKDLIGGLEPRRSEVDFGDRDTDPKGFYYRLNAGPLKTFGEAKTICDAIAADGGDCWVRPPLPSEGRVPTAAKPETDGALQNADTQTNGTADADVTDATPAPALAEVSVPEFAHKQALAKLAAPAAQDDSGDAWIALDELPAEGADGAQTATAATDETQAPAAAPQVAEQAPVDDAAPTLDAAPAADDTTEAAPATAMTSPVMQDSAQDYVWDSAKEEYVAKQPTGVFADVPEE